MVVGGIGTAYGSLAQGIGNLAYFGDPYSLEDLGLDVALGAVTGGAFNGLAKAVCYWKSRVPARAEGGDAPGSPDAGAGDLDFSILRNSKYQQALRGAHAVQALPEQLTFSRAGWLNARPYVRKVVRPAS